MDSRFRGNDVEVVCHARKGVIRMDSRFRGKDVEVVCHARLRGHPSVHLPNRLHVDGMWIPAFAGMT
jgi:hypothetical protein